VIALVQAGCLFWPVVGYGQDVPKDSSDRKPRLEVSGVAQFFFKARVEANGDGTTEPSVFRMQRVRISFQGQLSRRLGYDIEIDPRAPEITGILRDAFITLAVIPHHQLRVGQQKTQFGYENLESSSRLFVVNRSEISENLGRGINLRDIGLGLVGRIPLTSTLDLEDGFSVVNGSGMNVQADSTRRKNVWGRVGLRYKEKGRYARIGLSGGTGDQSEPTDPGPPAVNGFTFDFTRWGGDIEIDHPLGFMAAEYMHGNDRAPASAGASGTSSGYYVLLAVKLPHHVGPLVRYDKFEEFKRWTFGAFFGRRSDALRVLLNYEILEDDLGKHDDKAYVWLQTRF
jgi:hypothetical protein